MTPTYDIHAGTYSRTASTPSLLAAAACLIGGTGLAHAQPWETILPHPAYDTGDLLSCPCGGGRSVLIDPANSPDVFPQVYVGAVRYDNLPTVVRLSPDNPAFPTDSVEWVDGEPTGGMAWVPRIVRIDGQGLFAIGRSTATVSGNTTYQWRVRTSQSGDAGTWTDVDNWTYNTKSAIQATPHGIAASETHVFVSGMASDGRSWHWIIRRKELNSTIGFKTIFDLITPSSLEAPICYFPGNANNPEPAVLTAGVETLSAKGKAGVAHWTVRRIVDVNAPLPSSERQIWVPASYANATPVDIACEPTTGNIYVVGGLGGAGVLPNQGWVLRVNRFGGRADQWDTLIENSSQGGAGQRIAFDAAGTVSIAGRLDPTRSFPLMTVIRNVLGQTWADSWANPSQPFAPFQCGSRVAIDADASGALYVTGEVRDYVDADGNAYPGTRLALSRWIPAP